MLTPELQEKIVSYIKQSVPCETAAQASGIARRTYYDWMQRGREALEAVDGDINQVPSEQLRFVHFLHAVEKAQAEAETRNVLIIQNAGNTTWQAAAWMLERRYPDRYGKREKLDMDAKVTHSLEDVLAGAWAPKSQDGDDDGGDE